MAAVNCLPSGSVAQSSDLSDNRGAAAEIYTIVFGRSTSAYNLFFTHGFLQSRLAPLAAAKYEICQSCHPSAVALGALTDGCLIDVRKDRGYVAVCMLIMAFK